MALVLFEDSAVHKLEPLTATRAVYELMCGTSTLVEKTLGLNREQEPVYLFTRPYLADVLKERFPKSHVNRFPDEDELLLVNGCTVVDKAAADAVCSLRRGEFVTVDGRLAAARLYGKEASPESIKSLMGGDPIAGMGPALKTTRENAGIKMVNHIWDIVELAPLLVAEEAAGQLLSHPRAYGKVYAGQNVHVDDQAFIDGRKGPVVLGDNVVVEPFSKVVGPAYVGPGSVIFSGSSVVESCIGPVCRVGGEVDSSVFQGFSNKRHYGFIGHSVVGEWVNFGAGTTVSNLKNTYGTFRPRVSGVRVESGKQFMGSFFGDHVKTGIGCMVSGGLAIGACSHLLSSVHEDVPAFTIYTSTSKTELYLESALSTARRMMSRRNINPSQAYVEMLKTLFHRTKVERERLGVRAGEASFYNS
ncbi:MAG: putative sugar nucleotidyl transferase [Candidatus Caldarchaeum sp.]|nr:putative sugar nucleotidyl transferase [Candidatus Caldarchaeum sp.]